MTQSSGEIPKKIDRYEIVEAVGFGAMGAVYRAFDPLIKRPVAVKTLRLDVPPQSPDYKAFLDRFATEARTAGRLSHPNIITLYDVGHTEDQIPWLAMEFVEGETVAELLEGERLRPEVVVSLVSQIASALDYAHSEGVIHRDIKPSNVIVYAGEKVKVTDFGIAKLMDAEITHSGLMMGTPSYMSPEQAMGEDLDGRTDIFSLGVVAFEMLSGRQPFPGNNVTSILYKLVHADPIHPDDLEVLGLLPDKWHEVFSRVLAKDPAERFETAAEFVEKLEHCLGSWFGALEGETVIIKHASELAGSLGGDDDDATVIVPPEGSTDETVLMAPAKTDAIGPGDDETIYMESSTETLEREGVLPGGERTEEFLAPSPKGADVHASDETLYAGSQAEETVYAPDAASATIPATDKVSTSTVRVPPLRRKHYIGIAAGAVLMASVVLGIVLGRGEEEPAPVAVAIPEPPPAVMETGSIIVTTDPEGALVTVNGEERGTTPLELEDLPLGDYGLHVVRDGFHPEELSASLTGRAPRATLDLALRPTPRAPPKPAYVLIRSEPDGARVAIDGSDVGTTPMDRHQVPAGNRTVRIERDGFLPWEDTVRARAGRTAEVDAILTERPPQPAPEPEPTAPVAPQVVPGTLVERGEPGVVNPKCIECPAVGYPEAARRNRIEGVVLLSFVIDENGAVQDVRVEESGGEVFDTAVTETVSGWRYEPATKNGVPVKMRWVQRFRFRQGR